MQNAKLFFFIHNLKIGGDEIIFVRSKVAKAEHTLAYVSISLSADSCKKNSSERFYPTEPSRLMDNSFCASTANSIGNFASTSRA